MRWPGPVAPQAALGAAWSARRSCAERSGGMLSQAAGQLIQRDRRVDEAQAVCGKRVVPSARTERAVAVPGYSIVAGQDPPPAIPRYEEQVGGPVVDHAGSHLALAGGEQPVRPRLKVRIALVIARQRHRPNSEGAQVVGDVEGQVAAVWWGCVQLHPGWVRRTNVAVVVRRVLFGHEGRIRRVVTPTSSSPADEISALAGPLDAQRPVPAPADRGQHRWTAYTGPYLS